jgi:hypothetical protein
VDWNWVKNKLEERQAWKGDGRMTETDRNRPDKRGVARELNSGMKGKRMKQNPSGSGVFLRIRKSCSISSREGNQVNVRCTAREPSTLLKTLGGFPTAWLLGDGNSVVSFSQNPERGVLITLKIPNPHGLSRLLVHLLERLLRSWKDQSP